MEQMSLNELLELHHITFGDAKRMNLLTKCSFCKEEMIRHTQNNAWWHLIYLSEGKNYEEIYGK